MCFHLSFKKLKKLNIKNHLVKLSSKLGLHHEDDLVKLSSKLDLHHDDDFLNHFYRPLLIIHHFRIKYKNIFTIVFTIKLRLFLFFVMSL
jgi:hypothetical protein